MVSTKQPPGLFNPRARNRTPITVRLSPDALALLEKLVAIEGAKNFAVERAIERALYVLDSHVEIYVAQVEQAAAEGRDIGKLMDRLKPDFTYRETQ